MKTGFLIAIGFLLLIPAFFGLRHYVMVTGTCAACKTMYTLVAPPSDYFEPLVSRDILLEGVGEGAVVDIHFAPRYHGRHIVELSYEGAQLHRDRIGYTLVCRGTRKRIDLSSDVRSNTMRQGAGGFALAVISVPDDFQVDEEVLCSVRVEALRADTGSLIVRKISDI